MLNRIVKDDQTHATGPLGTTDRSEPRAAHASPAATVGRTRSIHRHARARLALAGALAAALILPGCAWTLVTTADAVGSMTQAGFAVASHMSSPSYVTGERAPIRHVCIEINNSVNDENLVPALRVAFGKSGVSSMVYNAGTSPPDCEARLTYTATMDFGHQEFSDGYTRYLSSIDMRLQHGNAVVAAHYQTEGLNLDRFSTTANKMRGLVARMVTKPTKDNSVSLASAAPPMNAYGAPGATVYNGTGAGADVVPVSNPPSYSSALPSTAGSTFPAYSSTQNATAMDTPGAGTGTPWRPKPASTP